MKERTLPRTALLILGMHRSGTSALTRLLSYLGASLPENMLAAGRGNETGHWEPERLVRLHDEMLAEAGSRWDDWRSFDPELLGEGRLAHYRNEIERLIRDEYSHSPLLVIKDPRICRFVPLYEQILVEMNIELRYVLTYRNPVSVLDSLAARDAMSSPYGALVWLRHVVDAEKDTRNRPRTFLAYEDYLTDWRPAIQKLASDIDWKVDPAAAAEEIDGFLSTSHQHHRADERSVETDERIGEAVREAYESLVALSADGEDSMALRTMSQIGEDLESGSAESLGMGSEEWRDRATEIFTYMNERQHRERLDREHLQRLVSQQKAELKTRHQELEARLSQQEDQTNALLTQRSILRNQIEAFRADRGEFKRLIDSFKADNNDLRADNKDLKADNKDLRSELAALRNSTSWKLTRPIRIAKRLATEPRSAPDTTSGSETPESEVLQSPPEAIESSVQRSHHVVETTPIPGMANLSSEEVERIRGAFDEEFYLRQYPEISSKGMDAFEHYMRIGWKEMKDPSPHFSTSYYLHNSPQIARAGVNPFTHWVVHGFRERRLTIPFARRLELMDYEPKVSVVVPNYNHARFLEERLNSILTQTYRNFDILVLDDNSTDDSRAVIERLRQQNPDRIRTLFNDVNSGNVFRQWRKGIENSDGDLVWICESDDFCEPDFLDGLIEKFRDRSVNLAFGRIQFANRDGDLQEGMDQYREGAESGIWDAPVSRPARSWFSGGFGVNNVIANVGGCLLRRQSLSESIWREAEEYSILGDWFLYAHLAGGGKIAYEPSSIAYFRQHEENTSVASFVTPGYYREHERLMTALRRQWGVPDATVKRFCKKLSFQYAHHGLEAKSGSLVAYCDENKLLAEKRDRLHILIAFLGFYPGGGEVFPIHLANELHAQGHRVSMLALDLSEARQEMEASLDPAIPVYDSTWVKEYGADRFLADAGISLIHSHIISMEAFFLEECRIVTQVPYLVTLHGSYEASSMSRERLIRILLGVSHFVYTADKNLDPFQAMPLSDSIFTKLGNALPDDPRPFPKTREELGIAEDAVVFTLVARGIQRKGWRASISAFRDLRAANPNRNVHLLLCGEGEETDRHLDKYGTDPDITFLGYQSHINGLYRLSDVALVPTRFSGESYPLCITQALQTGTPVISTELGEIESMMNGPEGIGGILIPNERDTDLYTKHLQSAMTVMLTDTVRRDYAHAASRRGEAFSLHKVAEDYAALYERFAGFDDDALTAELSSRDDD